MRQGQVHNIEEVQEAEPAQIASVTTYDIPPQEPVRVVQVTAWLPREPLEVLREEREVYA